MFRIIIADDHPVVLQAVKQIMLEEFPSSHIEEAFDTSSLIEKALAAEWDLVISDLAMPGGGGFLALKRIRQSKKNLPVLIISTYPAEQYRVRVLQAGAIDFISKDLLSSDLVPAAKKIFEDRSSKG